MSRTITLNERQIKQLITTGETDLGLASRTIHLTKEELFMNYEGTTYSPKSITVEFEQEPLQYINGEEVIV